VLAPHHSGGLKYLAAEAEVPRTDRLEIEETGGKRLPFARFSLSRAASSGTYSRYTQPAAVVRKR
jgi:hypothetical protein